MLTRLFNSYPDVFFNIIYLHFFTIFRAAIKKLDRKSTLYTIYEVLVSHIDVYLKNSAFLIVFLLALVYSLGFIVADGASQKVSQNPSYLFGVYLTWIYDSEWLRLSKKFMEDVGFVHTTSYYFTFTFVFISICISRNVVSRLFCAVVIGSRLGSFRLQKVEVY